MSDLVGKIIAGRYRVDVFLGRGGMADVYKVWDQERAAFLALKVLHDNLAEDQIFVRRFRREAQNLAKLKHPNIVRFYEMGQDGELVFMLMEYVDGITLSKARHRINEPFTTGQCLNIAQSVGSALHFAHQVGLIHCDIKPANIMIDRTGRVLLTDFGIARISEGATTATMVGAGTPAYMSPEQVRGADPTPETDIYSLAVVMYELLTGGQRPFTGENASITGTIGEKIRWEQRKLAPPSPRTYNPAISPELEDLILRCMSKDRKRRPTSVTVFLQELQCAVNVTAEPLPSAILTKEDTVVIAAPQAAVHQPTTSKRKMLVAVGVGGAALVILALVCGAGAMMMLNNGTETPVPSNPATAAPIVVVQTVEVQITSTLPPATIGPTNTPWPTNTPRPTEPPPLSVRVEHESSGYYIVATGGPQHFDSKCGPFARGSAEEGPTGEFAVYVDNQGNIYICKFEQSKAHHIETLNKRDFQVLIEGLDPNFDLRIEADNNETYHIYITELRYNQRTTVPIPREYTRSD